MFPSLPQVICPHAANKDSFLNGYGKQPSSPPRSNPPPTATGGASSCSAAPPSASLHVGEVFTSGSDDNSVGDVGGGANGSGGLGLSDSLICPVVATPPTSCGWTGSYRDFIRSHLLYCQFREDYCPWGCGATLLKCEMERHVGVCPAQSEFRADYQRKLEADLRTREEEFRVDCQRKMEAVLRTREEQMQAEFEEKLEQEAAREAEIRRTLESDLQNRENELQLNCERLLGAALQQRDTDLENEFQRQCDADFRARESELQQEFQRKSAELLRARESELQQEFQRKSAELLRVREHHLMLTFDADLRAREHHLTLKFDADLRAREDQLAEHHQQKQTDLTNDHQNTLDADRRARDSLEDKVASLKQNLKQTEEKLRYSEEQWQQQKAKTLEEQAKAARNEAMLAKSETEKQELADEAEKTRCRAGALSRWRVVALASRQAALLSRQREQQRANATLARCRDILADMDGHVTLHNCASMRGLQILDETGRVGTVVTADAALQHLRF